MDKKGFDNLTIREQEAQKKGEETENQNQETPVAGGEPASCEHQEEREQLERESQADAEEKHDDGMMGCYRLNAGRVTQHAEKIKLIDFPPET